MLHEKLNYFTQILEASILKFFTYIGFNYYSKSTVFKMAVLLNNNVKVNDIPKKKY